MRSQRARMGKLARAVRYRNVRAWDYSEIFLVSAVSAILAIRLFLKVMGYPRIEAGALHIAHMLWGGLLMLAAIVILLSFLGKTAHLLSAFVGGVGFGTFIDEIGKFVTKDNDYFFQPAVALIYLSFVGVYLTFHAIRSGREYSPEEWLANALRELEDSALHGLREDERRRTLIYLARSDGVHPLALALVQALGKMELLPGARPDPLRGFKRRLAEIYRQLAARRSFRSAVVAIFVFQLAVTVTYAVVLILVLGLGLHQLPDSRFIGHIAGRLQHLAFTDWAHLVSAFASGVFIFLGVVRIRTAMIGAFEMFERSLLVSIFVTQFFSFYRQQFGALVGLAMNLAVLLAVRFVLDQERLRAASVRTA